MPQTNPQDVLLQLQKDLTILQVRETKYAGNAPLDLLHQIDDYKQAITLTEQNLSGELIEAEWREALRPLLVTIHERSEANGTDCGVSIGDVWGDISGIVAGRDVIKSIINTGNYNQFFIGNYEQLDDAYLDTWSVFDRVNLDHFGCLGYSVQAPRYSGEVIRQLRRRGDNLQGQEKCVGRDDRH